MSYSVDDKPDYQMWDEEAFQSDLDVRVMTWIERYIYKGLLTGAWVHSTRPDLPIDPNKLWKLAGCQDRNMWDQYSSVPLSMFSKEDRGDQEVYYQNRLRKDWKRLTDQRESYSNRGKKGAESRYTKSSEESPQPTVKQKELNPLKLIPTYCRNAFGRGAEKESYYRDDLKSLAGSYGGTKVCDAFESWANSQSSAPSYPVRAFLKVAESYLQEKIIKEKESPTLEALCTSLYHIGKETFTGKNREGLNNLLSEFSFQEVERAYKEFIQNKDEFDMKFATKNFSDGGGRTIILANRETKEKEKDQEQFLKQATEEAQASVQQTLANLDEELTEENL